MVAAPVTAPGARVRENPSTYRAWRNLAGVRVREGDLIARLGGDEFGILLPETGPKAARHFIERIRDRLCHDMQDSGWPVTFSIGVVTFMRPPIDVNEAIRIADSLMYSAKNSGKNTIKFEVLGKEMRQPSWAGNAG